jgi:hypothetical protein
MVIDFRRSKNRSNSRTKIWVALEKGCPCSTSSNLPRRETANTTGKKLSVVNRWGDQSLGARTACQPDMIFDKKDKTIAFTSATPRSNDARFPLFPLHTFDK